ncbi:MAG: helix-turn-helix transcriptional regulator [Lachnospiraceae bacterium]|nr:helix-turn-helix transcriptional regulator [Lachnospiraceae bacterium]
MSEHGKIVLHIDEIIKKSGLSKNRVCQRAEIQHSQLNKMINNQTLRIDLDVLARLCDTLGCDINDILEYKKPE